MDTEHWKDSGSGGRHATVESLSQAELDDAYHRAVFDCDQALADTIRRRFYHRQEQMVGKGVPLHLWNAIRDELHKELSTAFNDCEVRQLGDDRYQQLMKRLWSRDQEQKPV
ncbi:hypothetical protein [Mesorhizobium sp. M0870]|uniref:hypothetical protein n=1 Tax=Mesorhizobium sp. M0870 TaxID=2957016 RepID=UPI0033372D8D